MNQNLNVSTISKHLAEHSKTFLNKILVKDQMSKAPCDV